MSEYAGVNAEELAELAWRFTPHTFAAVASGGKWLPFRAQRFAGNLIARQLARGRARLMICWPPRHGKSELFAQWTPAWFVDNLPTKRVILTSYDARLSRMWGRRVRNILARSSATRTALDVDSKRADQWNTPQGGGMLTAGVEGGVTGYGGDLILIDDPFKNWSEATNPLIQQKVYEFYRYTLYDRLEPNGSICITMQRWDEGDLIGRLLQEESDEWTVIVLPALAEEDDILGRAPGEALCPERYSREQLLKIRAGLHNASAWNAKYQQRPDPSGVGNAYRNYDRNVNLDASIGPRKDLPLHISLDFNIEPGMHLEVGQYDEREDQATCFAEVTGPRWTIPDAMDGLAEWIKEQGGWQWPELHVFGDAAGHSEDKQTAKTDYDLVAQHLRKMGITNYRIRVPRAAPSQADSVNAMNDALRDIDGKSHYRVHPRCERLVADLRLVRTGPNRKLVKTNSDLTHASDAERYRITFLRPTYEQRRPSVGGQFSV